MGFTQINQVWNLLHSVTKPFQQVFTSHHISWTKEFCTNLWFPDFLCCYCHKNSVNILHFQHQFFKHLIINKWARVLIFLFWVSWSSYLQHISTTSLKIVYEKWLITVGKCALFPGRCHIHITFFQLKQIHPHHTCDLIQKSSKKSVILIRLPLIS